MEDESESGDRMAMSGIRAVLLGLPQPNKIRDPKPNSRALHKHTSISQQ